MSKKLTKINTENKEKEYVIYKSTDKLNGLVYIGLTCNFRKRRNEHYNEHKLHDHFHNALKVRPDTFEWDIIESGLTFKEANDRELYWISYYDSFYNGYNNTLGGDGTKGRYGELNSFYGKHHTAESKKKISANHDYSHMFGDKNPNAKRIYTEEERKRLSEQARKSYENMSIEEKCLLKEKHRNIMLNNNPMKGISKSIENGWHLEKRILKNGAEVQRWIKNK